MNIKYAISYIREQALFVLLGFVIFSSFDSTLCLDILHLPQLMPELLIIPFIPFLRSKIKSFSFDYTLFWKLFIVLFLLALIAIGYGSFQLGGILSLFRSYLYLVAAICLFKNPNNITTDNIQWLMLGSLIGWYFDARNHFLFLIVNLDNDELTYGLLLAFPIFFSIVLSKKRYVLSLIGLALSTGIFVFAGLRRTIVVFLISIIVIVLLQFMGNFKKLFSAILVTSIMVSAFYIYYDDVESFVYDSSPQLHYRMFVRTEESLTGNAGSADTKRAENFSTLSEQGVELLLPKGLYTNHTSEKDAGKFNDFPLSAIIWSLGLPFTIVLLGFMAVRFKRACAAYRASNDDNIVPYISSIVVMGAMLFLDGTYLSYVYCAPITGLCIGKLLLFSNTQIYDKHSF